MMVYGDESQLSCEKGEKWDGEKERRLQSWSSGSLLSSLDTWQNHPSKAHSVGAAKNHVHSGSQLDDDATFQCSRQNQKGTEVGKRNQGVYTTQQKTPNVPWKQTTRNTGKKKKRKLWNQTEVCISKVFRLLLSCFQWKQILQIYKKHKINAMCATRCL